MQGIGAKKGQAHFAQIFIEFGERCISEVKER
jgi:hypothetical protein